MYSELCKGISKIAVGLELYKDDKTFYPVITQNQRVLDFFNANISSALLLNNDEIQQITAYEVTLDKIVTINLSDVKHIHWWGIPYEVPPPTYLLPELSGYVTDEQLFELQKWFLERIKVDKERGCFSEETVTDDILTFTGATYSYFQSIAETSNYATPLLRFFKDWSTYSHFNTRRNLKDTLTLLDLYKSMFFIPAVQACIGRELSIETDLDKFVDKSIFNNLKDKWIDYLEKKRVISLEERQKEIVQFLESSKSRLTEILKSGLQNTFDLIDTNNTGLSIGSNYVNYTLPEEAWNDFIKAEGLVDTDNNKFVYANVLRILGVPQDHIDILLEQVNINEAVNSATEYMKGQIDDVIDDYRQIKTQYELVINKLNSLNIEKELEGLDDYRIYLRYWPEYFDYNDEFFSNIRPFTDIELYIIKFFIKEQIEFDVYSLYKQPYDNYNSIVDILYKYKDKVIEKRLNYINSIAQKRKEEIEKEMQDVELSKEEKKQFDEILHEMVNIEKYKEELDQEKNLIYILAYWPVTLYPVPEDILQL